MTMTDVSIILTTYNSARFLSPAVESILQQSWVDFELLAVDDGSSDESALILDEYARADARVRVIRQSRLGPGAAINPAARAAHGTFLLICDSDDVLLPDCLRAQVNFLQTNPDLVGAGCLARFVNQQDKRFWRESNPFLTRSDYHRMMQTGEVLFFRHTGFIMRKAAYLQTEGYRPVPQANDIYFFNRLADVGPILTNPNELVLYRMRAGQVTTSYRDRLAPRLEWAWIAACNRARRAGQPEPERDTFRAAFERRPWRERVAFSLPALATSFWYEAKVDFICQRWQFAWKAALAVALKVAAWILPRDH